ncbi:T9SS type A sorting domain-containing protein [Flavobacterium sp. W22_SRS_FK3]|uniref:T9SS type A sorting domain-containing protein n=1 Tax=Flavobacterium sp. W22_SRS_FK3 TaxID=3240275 RepID=UPI003F8EDBD6
MKKKLLYFFIFLICSNLFSQELSFTSGPVGYGTNANADDNVLVPFFNDQSYIYCSTQKVYSTNPVTKRGIIVRVNISDGTQYIYPEDVFLPASAGFNAKKLNNSIFFEMGIRLIRLDLTTNKLSTVSYDTEDYAVFDHYLIYENSNYSGLYIYDLNTSATTQIFSPNNRSFYRLGATYYDNTTKALYFRSQYITTGVYYGFYKYIPSTKAITEIVGRNVVTGSEIYQQRDEIAKVNENLVFLMKDTDYKLKYFSVNLTTGTLNSSFTFNTNTIYDISVNDLMVFDNTVYLTTDKVYTSDGVLTPIETNYQSFFEYSSGYSIDIVYFNNEAYLQQNSSQYGSELFKYNPILHQKELVKDITVGTGHSFVSNISGGYLYKNRLLYVVNTGPLAYSIYATDGSSDGTVGIIGNDKFVTMGRLLTDDDNSNIYFYGDDGTKKGLFTLKYNFLSTEDFSKDKKITFYPNPAKSDINFTETMLEIKVIDLNGKILKTAKNTNSLSIENLSKGVYLLEIKTLNEEKNISKMIKI